MMRTAPEPAPTSPNFLSTPAGGSLAPMSDLTCNRPRTRRIFSEIGFRARRPLAQKPRSHHNATPPRTLPIKRHIWRQFGNKYQEPPRKFIDLGHSGVGGINSPRR
ncbi:hypothetical protein AVEN_247870-1 [Araneus ventricosus]|uniref:Uncharacterized protein n=1 Tax=Araneus ventricosus TaxID=182803 RepID=A0A4Y2UKJ3_ARAVE|nr:hypothetical protein AVEN_247870-1 [Araneus ventricosus]